MRLSDFDYGLPEGLVAQEPVEPRDAARLLLVPVRGDHAAPRTDLHVRDLPALLRPGDLLVANRSRVLPARVRGRLWGGGRAEFLLLRQHAPAEWEALGRPARRLRTGDLVTVAPGLAVRVARVSENGIRHIQVECTTGDEPDAALLAAGSVPLPPYIRGWVGDPQRYQTIFADTLGSAAAPTAGLHFTRDLLDRLADRDVGWATVVLHVGVDTFRPIVEEDPAAHRMHREWYAVPALVEQQVSATRSAGGRVIAVGTTVVRTLESWAATGQAEGWTDLFIVPGHEFRVVDGLLTNFHLPRSTLLMLVSAFAGRESTMAAYELAVRERYRFYSFGDCMLIV